ncbi:MAG: nucleotidyltransferase family protein [Clostridia bacterium]|nr:nucleotidyltransferase family protein [Clostridia bacterium]
MNTVDILTSLLRAVLSGEQISPDVATAARESSAELFKIADSHDIAHVIASAMVSCGAMQKGSDEYRLFSDREELAFFRYKRLAAATDEICGVLDEQKIQYVLLKGAVVRELYPEPWMRMSGDIDLLVAEENLASAISAIVDGLGYKTDGKRDFHDVSLFSPSGVHLELHFSIKENIEKIDRALERVWDYATPVGDGSRYELTGEFFVLHLIAHAAYHFINGGCGIKPFTDIWLWKIKRGFDEGVLRELLAEVGLVTFYDGCTALIDAWFCGTEHTDLTRKMEAHVVLNSLCGDAPKAQVVTHGREGGRGKYILRRIFPPYSSMKIRYPVLNKHPYLLPVFEVVRWFEFAFGGDKKRVKKELDESAKITDGQTRELLGFLESLELN